jgi:hypothetical protein
MGMSIDKTKEISTEAVVYTHTHTHPPTMKVCVPSRHVHNLTRELRAAYS